ncbi:MAG: flavoprotein [Candidatus Paceibacterota bacterium]
MDGKKILVGITGGIAAYKVCSLVNMLISKKTVVRVVMTESAKKFITPLTFQSLTNQPVYDDLWNPLDPFFIEHISISHWPDIIVIAPATANTIGKIANGLADNLLTTIISASLPDIKIILCPAMNSNMWNNPMFQKNLKTLKDTTKFLIVEPRSGVLACRDNGIGKIADNDEIIKEIEKILL